MNWIRKNLFSSPLNSALTILIVGMLAWLVPPAVLAACREVAL